MDLAATIQAGVEECAVDVRALKRRADQNPEDTGALIAYLRRGAKEGLDVVALIDKYIKNFDQRIFVEYSDDFHEFINAIGIEINSYLSNTDLMLAGLSSELLLVNETWRGEIRGRNFERKQRHYLVFEDRSSAEEMIHDNMTRLYENAPLIFRGNVGEGLVDAWERGEWAGDPGCNQYNSVESYIEALSQDVEQELAIDGLENYIDYLSLPLIESLKESAGDQDLTIEPDDAVAYKIYEE